MKLVDILARELKVWPEGVQAITQGARTGVLRDESFREIYPSIYLMIADDSGDPADKCNGGASSSVTRAEWQAAVDALKAEKVVEWNGEGLPPVGPVEYKSNEGWRAGECLAIKGDYAVIWVNCGNVFAVSKYDTDALRPIRTPEQIAAEERERAIADMKSVFDSLSDELMPTSNQYLEILFGAIHDAGYRKFEIVDN